MRHNSLNNCTNEVHTEFLYSYITPCCLDWVHIAKAQLQLGVGTEHA